jgi:hypothetical protein
MTQTEQARHRKYGDCTKGNNSKDWDGRLLRNGVCTDHYSRFLYVGLSLAKTHSFDRKWRIRIVREFIFKSLYHANHTKEVKKLDDHDLPSALSTSSGRLVAGHSLVNVRNTNKETNLYHWPARRRQIYPPKVPTVVILELIRSNSRAAGQRTDLTPFSVTMPTAFAHASSIPILGYNTWYMVKGAPIYHAGKAIYLVCVV